MQKLLTLALLALLLAPTAAQAERKQGLGRFFLPILCQPGQIPEVTVGVKWRSIRVPPYGDRRRIPESFERWRCVRDHQKEKTERPR